jgi:hypothetical protein
MGGRFVSFQIKGNKGKKAKIKSPLSSSATMYP